MNKAKKIGNGEMYITKPKYIEPIFIIKPYNNKQIGRVFLGDVQFPREMIGKRVRFKVEVE